MRGMNAAQFGDSIVYEKMDHKEDVGMLIGFIWQRMTTSGRLSFTEHRANLVSLNIYIRCSYTVASIRKVTYEVKNKH